MSTDFYRGNKENGDGDRVYLLERLPGVWKMEDGSNQRRGLLLEDHGKYFKRTQQIFPLAPCTLLCSNVPVRNLGSKATPTFAVPIAERRRLNQLLRESIASIQALAAAH